MTTTKIHITSKVESFLSGSQAYQDVQFGKKDSGEHPENLSLMEKIYTARSTRKDKRVTVELTEGEVSALRLYAEVMEAGGRDNAWDPDQRADMNAAMALLRQIDAVKW